MFLLFFNYYYVFVSPKMIEVKEVKNVVSLFESNHKKQVDFNSRYFSDKTYYSATDDNTLYLFDEEGKLVLETPLADLDLDRIDTIASETLSEYSISFAMVDKKLVYVIVSDSVDMFVDAESFEVVLTFRKGVKHD